MKRLTENIKVFTLVLDIIMSCADIYWLARNLHNGLKTTIY